MALEMAYLILISTIITCVAALAERAVRVWHGQTRLLWVAAACAVLGVTVGRMFSATSPVSVLRSTSAVSTTLAGAPALTPALRPSGSAGDLVSEPASRVAERAGRARIVPAAVAQRLAILDEPLEITWLLSSLLLIVLAGWSSVQARGRRRRWVPSEMDGVRVLLTDRTGPAVIGLVRRQIVLPRWVMGLSAHERGLILRHETEHVRAGDPALVCAVLLMLIATPWNPLLWVMRRRLQRAIELDCDARVLKARVNARAYGALLLKVAQLDVGTAGLAGAGAAFSRVSDLRARIEHIAKPREAPRHGIGVAYLAGSLALFGVACAAPRPAPAAPAEPNVRQLAAQLTAALDADSSTLPDSEVSARRELKGRLQRLASGVSTSTTTSAVGRDAGTLAMGSVADLRRKEMEARVARDSLLEMHHRSTSDGLALARSHSDSAAALRARVERQNGDSTAIRRALHGASLDAGTGTLWILATPRGDVLRTAQSERISAADTITAERVAGRLGAVASAIGSFSVLEGTRLGLPGARVVWAVVNERDVR
jgi:hypothetical protein